MKYNKDEILLIKKDILHNLFYVTFTFILPIILYLNLLNFIIDLFFWTNTYEKYSSFGMLVFLTFIFHCFLLINSKFDNFIYELRWYNKKISLYGGSIILCLYISIFIYVLLFY